MSVTVSGIPSSDALLDALLRTGGPVALDFETFVDRAFPEHASATRKATDEITALLPEATYDQLARHSPGLKGFQWEIYLRLSRMRVAIVLRLLAARQAGQRVLDFGSYFGNFSLSLSNAGYEVDAYDSYTSYHPALDYYVDLLARNGVTVLDSGAAPAQTPADNEYDAALLMGVVEHIPHSPRDLLGTVYRQLKPGGLLIIDTPNLAYLYKRQRLMQGLSIYPPIEDQFLSEVPFEGHHREFTPDEVAWMLETVGFSGVEVMTTNFSIFAMSSVAGADLANLIEMQADPYKREVVFAVAQKPDP